jgi:hypothetical protein
VCCYSVEWMRDECHEPGSASQMAVHHSLQLAVQCLHTHPQHPAAAKLHSALAAALAAAHASFTLPPPAPSSPLRPVAAWCVDTSLATLPQVASASASSLARPLQLFVQRQLLGWIALCAEDDASTDLTCFLCERDGRVLAVLSALVRAFPCPHPVALGQFSSRSLPV